MSRLLFNRLHLTASEVKNKKAFYIDGLRSNASEGFNDFSYKIIDIKEDQDFILGYLVKYDPYGRGEYLDEKEGKVLEGGTKNNVIGKSLFIIQVSESVIAFEEIPNIISKVMFKRMFVQLFKSNHKSKVTELTISGITEQYSFVEEVKTLKKIKKLSISLVPSNPRNADLWKSTDERLREIGVTKYKESQESKLPNGIKIDKETIAKMAMSEDGYGESEATGVDEEGKIKTITTKQRNKEVSQELPHEIESKGINVILSFVTETFKRISERTKKS